jgi:nitrite reductase (NADH) large subunit
MNAARPWKFVCELQEILPDAGVAALIDGRQLAIFRVDEQVYALDNYDPNSDVNVLARGLVGDVQGEPVVASPVYKHHFSLASGRCLEDASRSVRVYPARVSNGEVWVQSAPLRAIARTRKLVVVGNGMAGMKVVEQLLELAPGAYEITVFGAEPRPNYNRILLSPVLAGEKRAEDIVLNPLEWYREKGVRLHMGDAVVAIDRRSRLVRSASGVEARYDRLLLATGSKPIVLDVPGADLPGVVTFRDLEDVNVMLQAARTHKRAVVIGGGLLGLEAAYGLTKQGMDVTVVHLFDTLMERQLDRAAAALLQDSLQKRGLKFRMGAKTAAILADEAASRAAAVRFEDGSQIPADLVVMAAGIRPNTELARAAGLRCDRGVLVNDTLQTFDPGVYAVGECVQHRNSTYGLVAPLFEQASVCATHLAEFGIGRYKGSLVSTQLKVTGVDLYSAGDFVGGPRSESLVLRDARRGVYKRIVIEDNRIRGAVLYGDVKDGPWYFELMTEGRDVGALRDKLLFGAAFAQ